MYLHNLRSSGVVLLGVPTSQLRTKGDRDFAVRAPRLWNDLPMKIRQNKSLVKSHCDRNVFADLSALYLVLLNYLYVLVFYSMCIFFCIFC